MRLLAKGENAALTSTRLRVRMSGSESVDVCALMLGTDGKVTGEADFVFYNQPSGCGVVLVESGVDVDLAVLPAGTDRVICALSVDGEQPPLGIGPPPHAAVADSAGGTLFDFTAVGLTKERAVIMLEFYRRQKAWKVRAVGQGFEGGLAALVTAHGIEVAQDDDTRPAPHVVSPDPGRPDMPGVPPDPTTSNTSPPPGTSDADRQVRILTLIFEDAARSAAGFRSAVAFAEQRREREMDIVFNDPRLRESTGMARSVADEKYADLVTRATADHRRDVNLLARELRDLTPKLPAALAPWEAPVWKSGRFGGAAGVRVGELLLPEAPDLQVPLVLSLPLRRPVWLLDGDRSGASPDRQPTGVPGVVAMARALIIRLLAADSSVRLHLCDLDGALTNALGELAAPAGGVLGGPISKTRQQRSETLRMLAERVDLLEMALSGGALDALPAIHNPALLVVTDVPIAFEAGDHHFLRYLADHAAGSGVQIVLLGDPEPGLSAELARASLILDPAATDSVSDGWVGLSWTFRADYGPTDPASIVFRT